MKNVDVNSTENQRIKGDFVGREVHANVNQMAEYILNKSHEDHNAPLTWDDVENYYVLPEYNGKFATFKGGSHDQRDEEIERLNELIEEIENEISDLEESDEEIEVLENKIKEIQDEISDLENLETEPQEVFEWWLVSNWLAEKLRDKGEVVIMDENIWGRTTTGQPIIMDYVISEICFETGILK